MEQCISRRDGRQCVKALGHFSPHDFVQDHLRCPAVGFLHNQCVRRPGHSGEHRDSRDRVWSLSAYFNVEDEEPVKAEPKKDFTCPNCEGGGKINLGKVIGDRDCPLCRGRGTIDRETYLTAFGLFLTKGE